MLIVCKAVRRAVTRALVSRDFPFGPLQQGIDSALQAGIKLVKEGGADIVKLDAAVEHLAFVSRHGLAEVVALVARDGALAAFRAEILGNDESILHPARRQIVFDHLRHRLEQLEMMAFVAFRPERDHGFKGRAAGYRARHF